MIRLRVDGKLGELLDEGKIAYHIEMKNGNHAEFVIPLERVTDGHLRDLLARIFYALYKSYREHEILNLCKQFDGMFSCFSDYDLEEELMAVSERMETRYGLMLWWDLHWGELLEVTVQE